MIRSIQGEDSIKTRGYFAGSFLIAIALLAPAVSQGRSLYFGVNANSKNAGTAAQTLAAETGVNRLREDFEWWRVEPVKGEWNWAETDQMYKTAGERGLSILPIPNSPPCWAAPKGLVKPECEKAIPASNAEYAEFVAEVAKRYGPGGDFWKANPELEASLAIPQIEILNEPYLKNDVGEWPNTSRYASLYKAAVSAGRSANPATRYLIESTVDAKTGPGEKEFVSWAEALHSAEPSIGSYIDGIAVHPYPGSHGVGYKPANGTDEAFENTLINYERWKAAGIGVNKPIWITEVGYSSCNDGVVHCVEGATQAAREETKAKLLTELLAELGKDKYAFVHAVYLYNLEQFTPASEPNGKKNNWYGISFGTGHEHLPAWSSFTSAVGSLDGTPEPSTTITGQTITGGNASFTFASNDGTATMECQIDSGSWSACTSPKAYAGVKSGNHTFNVRAVNAEATDGSPASYAWFDPASLASLPILDKLRSNFGEDPLSSGGKWSVLSWASSTGKLESLNSGWSAAGVYPSVSGAFWNPATFSDAKGADGSSLTMSAGFGGLLTLSPGRYLALWLNMPNPGSAKSGYQLRLTRSEVPDPKYTMTLVKWASGVETFLSSVEKVQIPTGSKIAIVDSGGLVSASVAVSGAFSSVLSVADSTYSNGYSGLEASGSESRSTFFASGTL